MTDLIYKNFLKVLKKNIKDGKYPNMKLPTERALSDDYKISRSSVKRAIGILAEQGVVFQKRGSGTFINPLYLKDDSIIHYHQSDNLGVTDNFELDGQTPGIKLLSFEVIRPDVELQRDLFLTESDFVYEIKRLRLFDDTAFMIETGYIPIKLALNLSPQIVSHSIFNYMSETENEVISKAYLTISADVSTKEDQELLDLKPVEPVAVMAGIFFLDDGTPFEYSRMRIHYKYLKYKTFMAVE